MEDLVICFSQPYTHANYNAAHKPNKGALGRFVIFSESVILPLLLYSGQFCHMPVSGYSYTFEILPMFLAI